MNFSHYLDYMKSLVDGGIPACEAIIIKEHEVLFHEALGFSDIEKNKKADFSDLYFIYSSSKVLTSCAIMKLMELYPEIRLTTPIWEVLPEWRDPLVKSENGLKTTQKDITLLDLLTMSAGLTYDTYTKNIREFFFQNEDFTARDFSRALAKEPLAFEPGEGLVYGLCHDVLFSFIEGVTGKRASQFVKDNICAPLGIKDLYYHKEGVEDRISAQYSMRKDGSIHPVPQLNEYIFAPSYDSGGAGVITSCSEFSKILDALACYGTGANGERILTRESVEEMKKNRLDEKRLADFYRRGNGMGCYGYGLGVHTLIKNYDEVSGNKSLSNIGEFGWGGASGANITIDTAEKLSVFFVMHTLNVPVGKGVGANHNENYRFKTRDLAYIGLKE